MNGQSQSRQDPFNHSLQSTVPSSYPGAPHQTLNQALSSRLQGVGVGPNFQNTFHRLPSGSPSNSPIISQNDTISSPSNHAGPSNTRSPLHQFSIPLPGGEHDLTAAGKRKQAEGGMSGPLKRRREGEDNGDDIEGGPGAKHWTEEEKTKLFHWIMAPENDDHWNTLRAAKNSALRECASEVFDNKKTYQALKGCYERNFNVFRNIYAFQTYSEQIGPINSRTDGDRIREYERRLLEARKAGRDVGGVNARTIDHWHRAGWYNLFHHRWNGDPATTARVVPRNPNASSSRDEDGEPEDESDYHTPQQPTPTISNPQPPLRALSTSLHPQRQPSTTVLSDPNTPNPGGSMLSGGSDQTLVNVSLTQNMVAACIQLLQTQSQQNEQILEHMRRREEREERDSRQRSEVERMRQEREVEELELKKRASEVTQRSKIATDVLSNPAVDPSVKESAGKYLKNLFAID